MVLPLIHFRSMLHLCSNQAVGFYLQNVTLPQVFCKYLSSKNQLPGFCISGTLVENGLMDEYQHSNGVI